MRGDIYRLLEEYGFILGENGVEYYFNPKCLNGNNWNEFEEGVAVSFTPYDYSDGKHVAKDVTRYYGVNYSCELGEEVDIFPGIHPMVDLNSFDSEQQSIIKTLGKTFYITNRGANVKLGASSCYRYFLIKPTDHFKEQFNLDREIIVVFSSYDSFEPRTFDAVPAAFKKIDQPLRVDKVCSIIISKDQDVVRRVKDILKNDLEMQVIIPFTYSELKTGDKTTLIIQRFQEHFYSRDLFAFESPLKKDIYFFGRRAYVHSLMNRHKSGENSGVFGLRRSGKTSVLEAIKRESYIMDTACAFIDCQNLYHFAWNRALYYTMSEIAKALKIEMPSNSDEYTEEEANIHFKEDLELLFECTDKNVLVLYDEIEHISPSLGMTENWKIGDDFIKYWQTIRSNYREWGKRFTFIIAGTNPGAIELITINGHDNPLFNQLDTESYLPVFNVEDTSEMVNKLGGYMGLTFDDIVCSNLTKDFGGHPYLIRHFCSAISFYVNEKRLKKPLVVTNAIYNAVMPIFTQSKADVYCRLITQVLLDNYKEEYRFLENLALGNLQENAKYDPTMITHLIGYGIIENNQGVLGYRIEVLKNYMARKYAYNKQNMSLEEKWSEISERRNKVEPKLRQMIKNQLKSIYGVGVAKTKVLDAMRDDLRTKYSHLKYEELFDPSKCEIYFSHLGQIVFKYYEDAFKHVFSKNKHTTRSYFSIINDLRKDCHAGDVTEDEMQTFRGAIGILEKDIKEYFGE